VLIAISRTGLKCKRAEGDSEMGVGELIDFHSVSAYCSPSALEQYN
jgi:hypothetical protein